MSMSVTVLSLLRMFTTACGLLTLAWGVYDYYGGDNGAQNGAAIKKIVGGIAIAVIFFAVFTFIMKDVEKAEKQVGMITSSYKVEQHITPKNDSNILV